LRECGWGRARGKERSTGMLKKLEREIRHYPVDVVTDLEGCSKSNLNGFLEPLPPFPLLTKEGSEFRQKSPTRFGEEPSENIEEWKLRDYNYHRSF